MYIANISELAPLDPKMSFKLISSLLGSRFFGDYGWQRGKNGEDPLKGNFDLFYLEQVIKCSLQLRIWDQYKINVQAKKNKSHWYFDCVVLLIPSTNFWDRQWSIGQMDCLFWGRSKENRFSHFNPFQAKQTSVWPEGLTISSSSSKPISDGD